MPIYLYECPKCKDQIELTKSISQMNDYPQCCNDNCNCDMNLLISQKTSFHLKGSGWYKDGYSKK